MQKPGKPRALYVQCRPMAACELPGLASIRSRTEYCAGRNRMDASVAYEILENHDLQPAYEIAKMQLMAEVSSSAPSVFASRNSPRSTAAPGLIASLPSSYRLSPHTC